MPEIIDAYPGIAVIIGIDRYEHGITPLRSAVNDATKIARVLKQHGYHVEQRINEQATYTGLRDLFTRTLTELLVVNEQSRLLIYFAGHGLALDGDDGPRGYVLPQSAVSGQEGSYLQMRELHRWIIALPCHHMLLILDCCFAGSFLWASTRDPVLDHFPILHYERYERFLRSPAWQVITSTGYDQRAADIASYDQRAADIDTYGERSDDGTHSPFALAFLNALEGGADEAMSDGVITANRLYSYLRDKVEDPINPIQVPGIWILNKHGAGEYIFRIPGRMLTLPFAPPLSKDNNPYRGLESYEKDNADLFFGRTDQIKELLQYVEARPLTVIVGPSGSGKSSLVKAGLIPKLQGSWIILDPFRPGQMPLQSLAKAILGETPETPALVDMLVERIATLRATDPHRSILLVIDQFEEVITALQPDTQKRIQFEASLAELLHRGHPYLHMVITIRSDFEPQFVDSPLQTWWSLGRYFIRPWTRDELREAILGPAEARVLYFNPSTLVERIINEVAQMPGALPLLSFTLSEMYKKYLERNPTDRALTEADYQELGEVAKALSRRATEEYEKLDPVVQETMQRIMLRMVSLEGGNPTRRQVSLSELQYSNPEENTRVTIAIKQFTNERLLVQGINTNGETMVEPAHDELVRKWNLLEEWINHHRTVIELQRRLTQAATEWSTNKARSRLWSGRPELNQIEAQSGNVPQQNSLFLYRWAGRLWSKIPRPHPALPVWTNALEDEFLRKSQWTRYTNMLALTALSILILTLGMGFVWQRFQSATNERLAEQQERAVQSSTLSLQAEAMLDTEPQLSLLLASESVSLTLRESEPVLPSSEQMLRRMVSLTDGKKLPGIYPSKRGIDLSSDGRWLVVIDHTPLTGGLVSTIIRSSQGAGTFSIWNVESFSNAHPVRTISSTEALSQIKFSPDHRWLIASTASGNILFWQLDSSATPIASYVFDAKSTELWHGTRLEITPDSQWLIVGFNNASYNSATNDIRIFDLTAQDPATPLHEIPLSAQGIGPFAVSPDHRWLAASIIDVGILLWKIDPVQGINEGIVLERHNEATVNIAMSPNNHWLATSDQHGNTILWNLKGFDPQVNPIRLQGHRGQVKNAIFSKNEQLLITAGDDSIIRIWDLTNPDSFDKPVELRGHTDSIGMLKLSTDDVWLVSSARDHTIRLWNVQSPAPATTMRILRGHEGEIWDIQIDSQAKTLVSTSGDRTLRLWKLQESGDDSESMAIPITTNIKDVVATEDNHWVIAAGNDGTLWFWQNMLQNPTVSPQVGQAHDGSIVFLTITHDQGWAITASRDNTVKLWDLNTSDPLRTQRILRAHQTEIVDAVLSTDSRWLVSGGKDGTVCIWDLFSTSPDEQARILETDGSPIAAVAISSQGQWVMASNKWGGLTFWNMIADEGNALHSQAYPTWTSPLMKTSPDSKWLGTAGTEPELWLLSTDGLPILYSLNPTSLSQMTEIRSLAFSPDGKWFLAGDLKGTIGLWSLQGTPAKEPTKILQGHNEAISALTITRDGQWLISGSADNTIRLWDLHALNPETSSRVLIGHGGEVTTLSLVNDEQTLLSGSLDNTIRVWPVTISELLNQACATAGRNLTPEEWLRFFPDAIYHETCP